MKFRLLIYCLIVASSSFAFGQGLSISLGSQTLPQNVSDWSSNPNLIAIVLNPGSGGLELANAHVVAEVANASGKVLATTKSKFAEQPALNGVLTAPRTYTWQEVFNPSAVTIDPSIRNASARTGLLPEGSFKLCLYLVDANGQAFRSVQNGCAAFRVQQIEPPRLLTPSNNANVLSTDPPKFSWTPVATSYGSPIHYKLRIVEVYAGQTPNQAILSNPAFFEENITTNFLLYPSSAPLLRSASGKLVWQVQALDEANNPIGRNSGKSNVGTFTVKKSAAGNGCTCGCGGTPRPACAHKGCVCAETVLAAGNGCNCSCGGTPRPYCAHADCKCAKAKQIIGDSATALAGGNGCDCGCGGTPRPYCAYKDCKCAKAKAILPDNTKLTSAGTTCNCGCGGTPRPYCAHKDCQCAKAEKITGDSATVTAAGNGCDCGCGGTPRPYCAYKDCKCAKAKAILPDNTGTVTAGNGCTCGCGGTPRPLCAHADCKCANATGTTIISTSGGKGNGCECGCGGTPRPICAHRDCLCAKTDESILMAGCTCGCGGTPRPTCAHKNCVCAQTVEGARIIRTTTSAGNGCTCGCGGTPRPACAHKDCICAKTDENTAAPQGNGCTCGCGGTPRPACAHKDCVCAKTDE